MFEYIINIFGTLSINKLKRLRYVCLIPRYILNHACHASVKFHDLSSLHVIYKSIAKEKQSLSHHMIILLKL